MPFIFEWEGCSYEDDPDDPGNNPPEWANQSYCGTKYGIDARSHPNVDIKNLTEDQAIDTYWSEWIKDGCDHLPTPLNWVFFDTAVNLGMSRANEYYKASNGDCNKFLDLRIEKYKSLGRSNPRSQKYVKGWVNRAEDLRSKIKA
jgi:lysozyme family protein